MTWIIGFGASDHMCYNKYLLFNIQKLHSPYHISLPNGQQTKAYEVGSINLIDNIVLHNVLHVPLFKFNLLSIAKLCKQLKYLVVFSESFCFLLQGLS